MKAPFNRVSVLPRGLTALLLALLLPPSAPILLNAATYYVWTNSLSDGPGTDWSNAFHTIQAAVDATTDGDTVLVTNGFYDTGGHSYNDLNSAITNRVYVSKPILLQSVNGPEVTSIVGASHYGTNGPKAVRCAWLVPGAILNGFTLTNGHTWYSGGLYNDPRGGGVYFYYGGTVTNCVLAGNAACTEGGGAYSFDGGTLNGCTLVGNTSGKVGGGVYAYSVGIVAYCTFISNSAASHGGGFYGHYNAVLDHTTFSRNFSGGCGGGVYGDSSYAFNYCVFSSNSAALSGGGVYAKYSAHTLNNCLLVANACEQDGGGAYCGGEMWLNNCTVSDNDAGSYGGGIHLGLGVNFLQNCIVYSNLAGWGSNIFLVAGGSFRPRYSCSPDITDTGNGNITNTPMFMNAAAGDYRLQVASPCIDAGTNAFNAFAASGADLDGVPRSLDGDNDGAAVVDMGCYEFVHASADSDRDALSDRDELDIHGTNPVDENTDHDPQPDGGEIVAGTDPTDRASYFRIEAFEGDGPGVYTMAFSCVTTRVYTVEWSSNLVAWSAVPGMSGLPGDASGYLSLSVSNTADRAFFRARVQAP